MRARSSFFLVSFLLVGIIAPALLSAQQAATIPYFNFSLGTSGQGGAQVATSVQALIFLTILTLSPTILLLMTSFLRIAIVLDFVKRGLSLQQVPPNSVLMGLALFITIFAMWGPMQQVYNDAFVPLRQGKINVPTFVQKAESPMRVFMYSQMRGDTKSLDMFIRMSKIKQPQTLKDLPIYVLIPAFVVHELTISFKIGILIYFPFIIIDLVVSSILMSMGMIMLPPVMISLPFKLILFVLVDGWDLVIRQLVQGITGG